jgi:hypothetical protein
LTCRTIDSLRKAEITDQVLPSEPHFSSGFRDSISHPLKPYTGRQD